MALLEQGVVLLLLLLLLPVVRAAPCCGRPTGGELLVLYPEKLPSSLGQFVPTLVCTAAAAAAVCSWLPWQTY
jgi:hypothetical protein